MLTGRILPPGRTLDMSALSDPFLMVSFHLSGCVCAAILRHGTGSSRRMAKAATLQLATVMHAISASLLCKMD